MKVILIDDEQLALDYLSHQLQVIGGMEIVGTYVNPIVGRDHILKEDIDVAFLDINLPEINGIELADQILEKKPDVEIVFVTAYNEYAVEAFELNAIDYVVKPVQGDRLHITMDRVRKRLGIEENLEIEEILHIHVSNYLTFEVEKGVFKPISWRTAKGQELFIYLLQNEGDLIQKSVIVDLLWTDDVEEGKKYPLLYTTIYNVRKVLKNYIPFFELESTADGYVLNMNNVKVDLVEWEKGLETADEVAYPTIHEYEEIMKLNQGAYLQNYDYVWAEPERYRLEKIWGEAALKMATVYEEQGDMDMAILWYEKLCDRQPEVEEAHFALMQLFAQTGTRIQVEDQYKKLKYLLDSELGIKPDEAITQWYESWKN